MTYAHQDAVVAAIMEYLSSHPQAADSVDGVTRWWLAKSGDPQSLVEVEHALAMMVVRGLLRKVDLPDGTVLYSRDSASRH